MNSQIIRCNYSIRHRRPIEQREEDWFHFTLTHIWSDPSRSGILIWSLYRTLDSRSSEELVQPDHVYFENRLKVELQAAVPKSRQNLIDRGMLFYFYPVYSHVTLCSLLFNLRFKRIWRESFKNFPSPSMKPDVHTRRLVNNLSLSNVSKLLLASYYSTLDAKHFHHDTSLVI